MGFMVYDKIPHIDYVKVAHTRLAHQEAVEQYGLHHPETLKTLIAHQEAISKLAEAVGKQLENLKKARGN